MIDHLPHDETYERAYNELNAALDVASWRVPGHERPVRSGRVGASAAPAWWHGDEAESQGMLAALGVRLD